MFVHQNQFRTLTECLLRARKTHGGRHVIAEDINRTPLTYNDLLTRSVVLGRKLAWLTRESDRVGILMPGMLPTVVSFWGLQICGKLPVMLNYTAGIRGLSAAVETAQIRYLITSRRFIEKAELDEQIDVLKGQVEIFYLEDVAQQISAVEKIKGLIISKSSLLTRMQARRTAEDTAVLLFTSGSEALPKGVALSHQNITANVQQMDDVIDFTSRDTALNPLPLFHSFGLTAGMILPCLTGMKGVYYPSPLHYKEIPKLAGEVGATMLFATNSFLNGYARHATPEDFRHLRYIFAGAEKLQEETRQAWKEKFDVSVFEGYGATEASPVIAVNRPNNQRPGTVGLLMPGIEYHLETVPGLEEGKRLWVRGPNIMQGYYYHSEPGVLQPPASRIGEDGWYDTGDIVTIDEGGFIRICGRAKRFAKVAGEMVSLGTAEVLASKAWPDDGHAAVAIPDERKGEQIVLLTTQVKAERSDLLARAQQDGITELCVPRKIRIVGEIPLLGTGKVDYVSAQALAIQN